MVREFEKSVFGYRIEEVTTSGEVNMPLKPMVGRAVKNASEVVEKLAPKEQLPDLIAEIKYDGERTQIHYNKGEINLFSRNCESQNTKFWLLKQRLELHFEKCRMHDFQVFKMDPSLESFILDGEIVFVGPDGTFMEFQDIDRTH